MTLYVINSNRNRSLTSFFVTSGHGMEVLAAASDSFSTSVSNSIGSSFSSNISSIKTKGKKTVVFSSFNPI